jgi:hypothetical protein
MWQHKGAGGVYYILENFFFQKTDFIKTKVAGCKGT